MFALAGKPKEGKQVRSGYSRRKRLAPCSSGKQPAERISVRAAPMVCSEESRCKQRGLGFVVLWFSRQLRCPKASKGRAESPLVHSQAHTPAPGGDDAPTTARVVGLQLYVFPPASVSEGLQRASGKPFGAPAGALPLPRVGNDAPTTARVVGLPPYGFLVSFGARRFPNGERKALWCARRRILLASDGN